MLGQGKKDKISYDEFNKLFCKGIFKDALINMTKTMDKLSKKGSEVTLSVKINEFQRN
jgi:hypothetical protein